MAARGLAEICPDRRVERLSFRRPASRRQTINELSYRSDNQSGLNFGLKPSTNDTVEIGSKTRIGNGLFTAALFQTNTDNEIVVDSSSGGRTSYKTPARPAVRGWSWGWISSLARAGV